MTGNALIEVGDRIPDVEVRIMGEQLPEARRSAEPLGRGTVVLIAVPGAFTRGCSRVHLPGYIERLDELRNWGSTWSRARPSTTRG